MFANLVGLEQYRPVLSQTGVKLVDTLDDHATWDQENRDPKDPDNPTWSLFPVSEATNQAGFAPNSFGFFRSLKICALSLLESDPLSNNNGTRIAGTQLEGWDTHNGQGTLVGTQPTLFFWLDINEHPMFGVNNRYLLERTDYRAVFWEILRDHMGAAPATLETIFPGYGALGLGAQELGFLSPCPTPGGST